MAKDDKKTELGPEAKRLAEAAMAADVGNGEAPPLPKQPQRVAEAKPKAEDESGDHHALRQELDELELEHEKLSLKARVQEMRAKVRQLRHGNKSDETVSQIEKREKIRAQTRVTTDRDGKKFAHYIIGNVQSYVHGTMLQPGASVTVPYDELPSFTWKAVKAAKAKQEYEAAD